MFKKHYTLEEVVQMDNLIMNLAIYDFTKGKISIPNDRKDAIDFQKDIIYRFNYFKNLIRTGETTIEDLKSSVANRWGAIKQNEILNIENPNDFNKIIKEIDEDVVQRESEDKSASTLTDFLTNLFKSAANGDGTFKKIGQGKEIPLTDIDRPNVVIIKPKETKDSMYNTSNEKKKRKPRTKKSESNN